VHSTKEIGCRCWRMAQLHRLRQMPARFTPKRNPRKVSKKCPCLQQGKHHVPTLPTPPSSILPEVAPRHSWQVHCHRRQHTRTHARSQTHAHPLTHTLAHACTPTRALTQHTKGHVHGLPGFASRLHAMNTSFVTQCAHARRLFTQTWGSGRSDKTPGTSSIFRLGSHPTVHPLPSPAATLCNSSAFLLNAWGRRSWLCCWCCRR
jgi:hypothetical protein